MANYAFYAFSAFSIGKDQKPAELAGYDIIGPHKVCVIEKVFIKGYFALFRNHIIFVWVHDQNTILFLSDGPLDLRQHAADFEIFSYRDRIRPKSKFSL